MYLQVSFSLFLPVQAFPPDVLSSAGLTTTGTILLDNSIHFARQMRIASLGLFSKCNTSLSTAAYFFHLQPPKVGLEKATQEELLTPTPAIYRKATGKAFHMLAKGTWNGTKLGSGQSRKASKQQGKCSRK